MQVETEPAPNLDQVIDIIGLTSDGTPLLVVEVKSAEPAREATDQIRRMLDALAPQAPYGMLVTPRAVVVYALNETGLHEVCRLNSADVFTAYDADFGRKRIFHDYFLSLVEAWLRDLAFAWKSPHPPAQDKMKAIGLADRLSGGTTRSEAKLGSLPLS